MEGAEARDRELRELLFLQQLAVAAASTMERDELLELIIGQTTGAMEADVCALYLYDSARAGLVLTATNGLNQVAVGNAVMRLGDGITGTVAASRQPLAVAEVATDPHFKWVEGVDEMRFTSMLSVPIEAGPRMVGVLNVQTVERRDFRPDELAFLSAIAGAIAGVLERAELQRRLEDQLEEIQLSQTVHERFTSLVLSGAGLGKILEAISSLAGGAVGLHDPLGFRLEHEAGSGLPLRRINVPLSLAAASGPVESVHPRPRIELTLTPVRAGSELIAVLAMEGKLAVASAGRRRALEHGATVVALELLKERAAAEVERRLRGDLLEGLLAVGQDPGEIGRLATRAERLGYRIPDRGWVLVAEPDDEASAAALQSAPVQERVQRDLTELCRPRFPGSMVLGRVTSTVVVVPAELAGPGPSGGVPQLAEMESFGRSIQEVLRGISKRLSLSIGIGNLANSTHELARAHEEARQALRLARRGGASERVTSYRSLGAMRLLLEVRDPAALSRFVDETLGPVLEYGQHRRTPLLSTLEALAANGWNQRSTAKALRIHINTLTYRVQRLEALLGVPLDDAELRVVLGIALQARNLQLG
jgi:sugar diacid utilization regulator/putative methionine-R-sulfoxide reductase with GAF domain